MLVLQNSAVKSISSVFITFSLCKQKLIFVNNSLRPTFININSAPVDHKRKVVFWLCLIHTPERICPSNQLVFFVFLTKLELVISTRIAKLAPVLTRQNSWFLVHGYKEFFSVYTHEYLIGRAWTLSGAKHLNLRVSQSLFDMCVTLCELHVHGTSYKIRNIVLRDNISYFAISSDVGFLTFD